MLFRLLSHELKFDVQIPSSPKCPTLVGLRYLRISRVLVPDVDVFGCHHWGACAVDFVDCLGGGVFVLIIRHGHFLYLTTAWKDSWHLLKLMALDWGKFYQMTINYLDDFHEKHPTKTIEVMMFREPLFHGKEIYHSIVQRWEDLHFFTSKAATPCPMSPWKPGKASRFNCEKKPGSLGYIGKNLYFVLPFFFSF